MAYISRRHHTTLAHRMGRAVGAVAIASAAVAATASAASADQDCNGDDHFSSCILITSTGNNDYAVHLGIDVYMSRQDAQSFIDNPGEEFSAKMYGDDPHWDNFLFYLPVTWSAAWDGGLSAEFDVVVDGSALDEDWEGDDEVYARIGLFDPRSGETRYFNTDVVTFAF
jgi:hypothetical protein